MPPLTRLCRIDVNRPNKVIYSGHLRLGGADPAGNRLDVTNSHLTLNGRPFCVISGEFHYSRYPAADWETELLKIKAGGVNTVATYTFWIFHEETPGCFEWDGPKSVRRFVELCARHGLKVILRIGPFAHGEWRNGGLPDWLYGRPFEVRSNDPAYLAYVERFYLEIGRQVQGLMFRDGGPIIGIQLENEYMHAGAPWEVVDPLQEIEWIPAGHEGAAHLQALKGLALRAGLEAPLYLVTAWGAPILEDESLPVYGGYAYPVWVDDPQPSTLYVYRDGHARPATTVTHRVPNYYPLIYAEMQGGIQIRYGQRPLIPPRSVEALAVVSLGNGSNWLGYYMYHGGTTPVGRHGFSHERRHPQLSYDFQAPLGEYGQYHPSYHALRRLHLFLEAYGDSLALAGTMLPDPDEGIQPEETAAVRYCVRARDGSGFLFVNNFQDHVAMPAIQGVVFEVNAPSGLVTIPAQGSLTIDSGACFILPFNQALGAARLLYATAQPLTVLNHAVGSHYFYFVPDGLQAEFCFAAETVARVLGDGEHHSDGGRLFVRPKVGQAYWMDIETVAGQTIRITTLTHQESEQAWRGEAWGAARVIVSDANLTFRDGCVEARGGAPEWTLSVWPPLKQQVVAGEARCVQHTEAGRTVLRLWPANATVAPQIRQISPRKHVVGLAGGIPDALNEVYLEIKYQGDTGLAFINGRLVADNFNTGAPWLIGLRRFREELRDHELCLVFSPLRHGLVRNVSSEWAGRMEFDGQETLTVQTITAIPDFQATLAVEPEPAVAAESRP